MTLARAPRRSTADASRSRRDRSTQWALLVFLGVEVATLLLLFIYGRNQWFYLDEWDFLAGRKDTVAEMFRPQNQHWSTLPTIWYRLLWWLVGLRTYVPYQVAIFALQLGMAALLRVVIRRAGVGPWIATAAASLFALFGTGGGNLIWAVQVTEVGSLAFGFVHLILADHDGPFDRRDRLGLLAGLAGLMCSGISVTMVVIVGLAVLLRRGWRMAALHTVPLGLAFTLWWFTYGREDYGVFRIRFRAIPGYVVSGYDATFDSLGQLPWAGFALGAMMIAGLVLAWGRLRRRALRRRAAVPAALLVGPAVMMAINALGRPFGTGFAREGRWSHLLAALCLPAIAVAADAIVRHSRALAPVAFGLLLIGIPGNVDKIVDYDRLNRFALGSEDLILTLPQISVAREVPREMKPLRKSARDITVGWLLDGAESGRIPAPDRIDPAIAARATVLLSLQQRVVPAFADDCRVLRTPLRIRMDKGDAIGFDGGRLSVIQVGANRRGGVSYDPDFGQSLRAEAGPLELRLASVDPAHPVALCD